MRTGVVNSDKGTHYNCENWVSTLLEAGIKISMDNKCRANDNAIIERFFGTLKRKHVYLTPASNGLELYVVVAKSIGKYNRRNHQAIN